MFRSICTIIFGQHAVLATADLEHDVDERGQELVGAGGRLLGGVQHLEDVLAALDDARQLVLRRPLAVHLNYICDIINQAIETDLLLSRILILK